LALSNETKAGAFFLIACVILGIVTFKVEEVGQLFKPTFKLEARFDHAGGLKEGDPVTVAGVRVGEVTSVTLEGERILVVAEIKSGVTVRKDANATISWQGLLGNKYLDITLGTSAAPALTDGAEIEETIESPQVSEIMENIREAVTEIQSLVTTDVKGVNLGQMLQDVSKIINNIAEQKGTLGKLVGSQELYGKIDQITRDFSQASKALKKVISDNEEKIGALIDNLGEASPDIKTTFESVGKLVEKIESGEGTLARLISDKKMYEDLETAAAAVRDFAENLESGKGLAQRLVSDEKLAEDVQSAVNEIRQFVKQATESQGTIHLLLTDRELYDDARQLMAEAKETLRSVKEQVPVGTFVGLLVSSF